MAFCGRNSKARMTCEIVAAALATAPSLAAAARDLGIADSSLRWWCERYGLALAKPRRMAGGGGNNPRAMTDEERGRMHALAAEGWSVADIAVETGRSQSTVANVVGPLGEVRATRGFSSHSRFEPPPAAPRPTACAGLPVCAQPVPPRLAAAAAEGLRRAEASGRGMAMWSIDGISPRSREFTPARYAAEGARLELLGLMSTMPTTYPEVAPPAADRRLAVMIDPRRAYSLPRSGAGSPAAMMAEFGGGE